MTSPVPIDPIAHEHQLLGIHDLQRHWLVEINVGESDQYRRSAAMPKVPVGVLQGRAYPSPKPMLKHSPLNGEPQLFRGRAERCVVEVNEAGNVVWYIGERHSQPRPLAIDMRECVDRQVVQ